MTTTQQPAMGTDAAGHDFALPFAVLAIGGPLIVYLAKVALDAESSAERSATAERMFDRVVAFLDSVLGTPPEPQPQPQKPRPAARR